MQENLLTIYLSLAVRRPGANGCFFGDRKNLEGRLVHEVRTHHDQVSDLPRKHITVYDPVLSRVCHAINDGIRSEGSDDVFHRNSVAPVGRSELHSFRQRDLPVAPCNRVNCVSARRKNPRDS